MSRQPMQNSGGLSQMITTHPQGSWIEQGRLVQAIQSIATCGDVCTACADACLGEEMVAELKRCIRLNLDCADICHTTARVLTRMVEPDRQVIQSLLQTCATICQVCGQECASHAQMHEHCRVCAESCRACEETCRGLLSS